MKLIIIHKNRNFAKSNGDSLLRFAISSEPIAGVVFDGFGKYLCLNGDADAVVAVPKRWRIENHTATLKMISYTAKAPIHFEPLWKSKRNPWLVVSNARFATQVDSELFHKTLAGIQADIVAVNVKPELLGGREKVRLTAQGKVAGFQRMYSDLAELAPLPTDWPHHIFIKTDVLDKVVPNSNLPNSFSGILKKCQPDKLKFCAINVGGIALDLETEEGLLGFCQAKLSKIRNSKFRIHNSNIISPSSRLVGKVLLGKNVRIGPKVIIVGPSIIGNNVKIGNSAVINSSIIGPGVCVPQDQLVQNRVIKGPRYNWKNLNKSASSNSKYICCPKLDLNNQQCANDTFRIWPGLSYAGCIKRIADIVAATTVLILFAPIFPIIAMVIKLTSRGPVFFKDTRQGLHGRAFGCLKFRTMILGADEIQDKLKSLSEVDGDHYKMEDDPRISRVGGFLRDTHIDEIPQFFNVLLGRMSVVGPRPSPESENTQCPSWRDARLSVRPGITGLWQICRTRSPMKDFQEWIYYDTKYVRDMSSRMDLWICWQTAKKLLKNFVRQF
jgi:lipopolysaccharide/colanic/teichoic acid biosynthesis glycosyltransferase